MGSAKHDPRVDPMSVPPKATKDDAVVDRGANQVSIVNAPKVAAKPSPVVTSEDPRVETVDRRIADNDWGGIVADLGSVDELGKLPPNLGLLAALAHNEIAPAGNQDAVKACVRCIAALLRVPEEGAIAGVVARRLMRKNPVRFRDRKAPPAHMSVVIVILTLVFGGGTGWLLSGGWGVVRVMLHLR